MDTSDIHIILREFVRTYAQSQKKLVKTCQGTAQAQGLALIEIGKAIQLSQKELSEKLGLEKTWISRLVRSLLEAGFIIKTNNPNDKRYCLISLSLQGIERHKKLEEELNNHALSIVDQIDTDEKEMVYKSILLLSRTIGRVSLNCKK